MATPPCELAQGLKPMTTNTLVAKSMGGISGLLSDWAASRVVDGAGAYAVVDSPTAISTWRSAWQSPPAQSTLLPT